MKLVYAKDPIWANRSKTLINLTVRFEEINEDLPFTANPNDSEAHGRDLFSRALAGEFGIISDFTAASPSIEQVEDVVRTERDKRLAETDWTQAADVPQSLKDKWAGYRQALRDIPQQVGFPWANTIVIETDFGFAIDISKVPFPAKP